MIIEFEGVSPKICEETYISESVDIIGNVIIEENANIWFGTRLRGDINQIVVGANSNIQENSVIHVDENCPCIIGRNVTIGHGAIIHGCNISDNVLVGMGAIILNNAKIGKNTIIGAGSLITQEKEFPEGVLTALVGFNSTLCVKGNLFYNIVKFGHRNVLEGKSREIAVKLSFFFKPFNLISSYG